MSISHGTRATRRALKGRGRHARSLASGHAGYVSDGLFWRPGGKKASLRWCGYAERTGIDITHAVLHPETFRAPGVVVLVPSENIGMEALRWASRTAMMPCSERCSSTSARPGGGQSQNGGAFLLDQPRYGLHASRYIRGKHAWRTDGALRGKCLSYPCVR